MRPFIIFLYVLFPAYCFAVAPLTVDVIVVEYPPYTTPQHPDGGLAFAKVKRWFAEKKLPITLNPRFLPPARAHHEVDTTDWCISFYPPSKTTPHVFKTVSRERINMRMVRKKADTPFTWSSPAEFKGSRIALLRPMSLDAVYRVFAEAGLEFVYVETMEQAITMVAQGRVDYTVADNEGLEFFNRLLPEDQKLVVSQFEISRLDS